MTTNNFDLVIIGAGSGGLTAAEFATTLGLRVAIVERGRIGGDCLWTGCVPSKALLTSAKAAHTIRHADKYGLFAREPDIDTAEVWKRIRTIQQEIADDGENAEAIRASGITLFEGSARLVGSDAVEVDGVDGREVLRARRILLTTGSSPSVPPIPGLDGVDFLTTETLFELDRAPASIIMIGGGPISLEMAQAFTRLGIEVTVLELADRVLPRDEPELVDILVAVLRREGVDLNLNVKTSSISETTTEDGATVRIVEGTIDGVAHRWEAEAILVATGRKPNVEGLELDRVGVETNRRGVVVDDRMRSSVETVYAAGDVAGRYLFTHAAGYEAVRAVRDMFLPGKGTADASIPWVTYTDPELAHAGMTAEEAGEEFGAEHVEVLRHELAHQDRARAESATDGVVLLVTANGVLVGAHALAPAAGELFHEYVLAISDGKKLRDLAGVVHAYPTLSFGVSQAIAMEQLASASRFAWVARVMRRVERVKKLVRRH